MEGYRSARSRASLYSYPSLSLISPRVPIRILDIHLLLLHIIDTPLSQSLSSYCGPSVPHQVFTTGSDNQSFLFLHSQCEIRVWPITCSRCQEFVNVGRNLDLTNLLPLLFVDKVLGFTASWFNASIVHFLDKFCM